jgi:Zn-finger nucleic acid-binding protein
MDISACTRCGKDFNKAMKVCPFCGMPHKTPPTKKKANCPKCHVALSPKVYREVELDVCPECSGMWLDTLDFEHLTSEKDVYADESTSTHFDRIVPENAPRLYECVRCNNIMNRTNFRRISGILIDSCCDHGAWLDSKELTQIRNFVASGGLDKSQDTEIRKNNAEIRGLATKVEDLEFMQKMLHRWSLKRMFFS